MNIREMKSGDLEAILDIENNIYISPWTLKAYQDELVNKYARYYVLEDDKIIGYYGAWIVNDYCTITKVSISKQYQGKGYSKFLMDHLNKLAVKENCIVIDLEVRISNIKAINLYKSDGFEIVNIRKKYYSDGEDAYMMIKNLKEGETYEKIHISA